MDTIHVSFDKCYQLFMQSADSSQDEAFVISTILAIESCIERVRSADIYSKSEGLEEYSTQSLKVSESSTVKQKLRISRSKETIITSLFLSAPRLIISTSRHLVLLHDARTDNDTNCNKDNFRLSPLSRTV